MGNKDKIEFYYGDRLIAAVDSSMVPSKGQFISIRQETWGIIIVTFAIDYSDKWSISQMRCNVDVVPVTAK